MPEICQIALTDAPWVNANTRRLPGVQPLDMNDWLQFDDAFEAQRIERARLLYDRQEDVLQCLETARDAEEELAAFVSNRLSQLGRAPLDLQERDPLLRIATGVVEDMCILQKQGEEHVLTSALLCFPANWRLSEKLGRPLAMIHAPVDAYTSDIARRVQRLFDAVQVGRPLWRANALRYATPNLFQPDRHVAQSDVPDGEGYLRSERQSILRLPETGAVVFSIHTRLVKMTNLTPEQKAGLEVHPLGHS
ncbi:MAG: DUF3445 domain-containing protein [Litoreibacter sp.]|nr:DUF3445 domain-containing protein [Litoreibacter sp.]